VAKITSATWQIISNLTTHYGNLNHEFAQLHSQGINQHKLLSNEAGAPLGATKAKGVVITLKLFAHIGAKRFEIDYQ